MERSGEAAPAGLSPADALFYRFARTRDQRLFEQLIAAHLDGAYSQARYLLRSSADAEDAVQEALIQLVRTSDRYDGTVSFAAWFGRLVQVSALQVGRARGRRTRHEDAFRSQPPQPEAAEADPEVVTLVRHAVGELPETLRMPMALHYFGGLSQEDTAKALQITIDTLGMRLHRARKKLRTILARSGVTLSVTAVGSSLQTSPFLPAPSALAAQLQLSAPALAALPASSGLSTAAWMGVWAGFAALGAAVGVALLLWLGRGAPAASPGPALAALPHPSPHPLPAAAQVPTYRAYPTPDGGVPGPLIGLPDGRIVFISIQQTPRTTTLYEMTPDGAMTDLMAGTTALSPLTGAVVADRAGTLWVSEADAVDRIDASGTWQRFPIDDPAPGLHAQLGALVLASDGALWATDQGSSSLARLSIDTGVFTRFPTGLPYAQYQSLTAGADGTVYALIDQSLWGMSATGRPFPIALTPALPESALVRDLVSGPRQTLLVIDAVHDVIYGVRPDGRWRSLRAARPRSQLRHLAVGPQETVAFSETATGTVGIIRVDGTITEYTLPGGGGPGALAVAPDGSLWIAQTLSRAIAHLVP